MIPEIIDISLDLFEQDCQQLKARDYPTIHNRGFLEFHLTKALSRRIQDACYNANLPTNRIQLKQKDGINYLPIYHIAINNQKENTKVNIWVIGEHLISAGQPSRQHFFGHIDYFYESLYTHNPDEENYLLLICDHWFDRNYASKTLPAWWLGCMPDALRTYRLSGIQLRASETSLADELQKRYGLKDGDYKLRHPLYNVSGKANILKYMLLTAVYAL